MVCIIELSEIGFLHWPLSLYLKLYEKLKNISSESFRLYWSPFCAKIVNLISLFFGLNALFLTVIVEVTVGRNLLSALNDHTLVSTSGYVWSYDQVIII